MNGRKVAIYPLSADPLTLGHIDIVERAIGLFPSRDIHVVIANNRDKNHFFTFEQRLEIAKASLSHLDDKIKIVGYEGIISNYANQNNVDVMIRGFRNHSDVDYELNLEQFTRKTSDMETIYLSPYTQHLNTSSSLVRMFLQSDNIIKSKTYLSTAGYETMTEILKNRKES